MKNSRNVPNAEGGIGTFGPAGLVNGLVVTLRRSLDHFIVSALCR